MNIRSAMAVLTLAVMSCHAHAIGNLADVTVYDRAENRTLPVPVALRDSHYGGATRLGHGEGYQYSHEAPDGIAAQDYLGIDREYYRPTDHGAEAAIGEQIGRAHV